MVQALINNRRKVPSNALIIPIQQPYEVNTIVIPHWRDRSEMVNNLLQISDQAKR